jgi:hypothetical protein
MNGLDGTQIILREIREARILIVSQNDPSIVRRKPIEACAHRLIEKSKLHRDLVPAAECILSGDGQSKVDKAS